MPRQVTPLKTKPTALLALGVSLVFMTGCTRDPGPGDLFTVPANGMAFEERLKVEIAAPLIVLGQVADVAEIGSPVRSRGDRRVKVQLNRIRIHIEQVIKGTAPRDSLSFLFYAFSSESEISVHGAPFTPSVGLSYIFFLEAEGEGYRSVGDVSRWWILRVDTGSHPPNYCAGKVPGRCVAELMMIPGKNANLDTLALYLGEAEYVAKVLCSRAVALDLLSQLTANPNKDLAEFAHQILIEENTPDPPSRRAIE